MKVCTSVHLALERNVPGHVHEIAASPQLLQLRLICKQQLYHCSTSDRTQLTHAPLAPSAATWPKRHTVRGARRRAHPWLTLHEEVTASVRWQGHFESRCWWKDWAGTNPSEGAANDGLCRSRCALSRHCDNAQSSVSPSVTRHPEKLGQVGNFYQPHIVRRTRRFPIGAPRSKKMNGAPGFSTRATSLM